MVERKSGPVKPPVLDLKASEKASEPVKDAPSASPDPKASADSAKPEVTKPAVATPEVAKSEVAKGNGPEADKASKSETSAADTSSPPRSASTADTGKDTGSDGQKPGGASASKDPEPPKPGSLPPPPPPPGVPPVAKRGTDKTSGPVPFVATALGGAILGVGLAYGLALAGLWPTAPATPAASPEEVAALQSRIDALETGTATPPAGLSELDARIGEIEAALATPTDAASADEFAALEANLSDLSARVDALAAGASGEDAQALGGEIAGLRQDVQSALEQIGAAASGEDLASLSERLDALETAAAGQPELDALRAERDRFAQLPSALSGLETAFETGAPFADQLFALNAILPDLSVPDSVTAASATGLPTFSEISDTFSRQIPTILSARTPNDGEDWLTRLAGQAQAALALRPVGDVEGDSFEAIIARAEAGIDRRDAQAALTAIQQLPDPLLTSLQDTIVALEARIAGEEVLAQARALTTPAPTNEEPGA